MSHVKQVEADYSTVIQHVMLQILTGSYEHLSLQLHTAFLARDPRSPSRAITPSLCNDRAQVSVSAVAHHALCACDSHGSVRVHAHLLCTLCV